MVRFGTNHLLTALMGALLTAAAVFGAPVAVNCSPDEFLNADRVCLRCSWCQEVGSSESSEFVKLHRDEICRNFASGCVRTPSQDVKQTQTEARSAGGSTQSTPLPEKIEGRSLEPTQTNYTTSSWAPSTQSLAWVYAVGVCVAVLLTIFIFLILKFCPRDRKSNRTNQEAPETSPQGPEHPLLADMGSQNSIDMAQRQQSERLREPHLPVLPDVSETEA